MSLYGLLWILNGHVVGSKLATCCDLFQVRILRSLFPPYLLELYKMLIAPIGGGKIAAVMVGESDKIDIFHFSILLDESRIFVPVWCSPERRRLRNFLDILKRFGFEARVTVLTCQWLMGPCKVNSVDLPDGTSCSSGVSKRLYFSVCLIVFECW